MAVVAPLPATHLCRAPAPGHGFWASGEAPWSPLLLPSFCAPQLVLCLARCEQWDLSPVSPCVLVQGQAELSVLPPAESPEVSPLLQRLRAASTDHLTDFAVRPHLNIIIFLCQSVFQVFLECHEWRAGLHTKCPVLNPIYMQKLCQFTLRLNQCKPLLWGLF